MGNCTFCQTKAGLFKSVHEICARDAESARVSLRAFIAITIASTEPAESISPAIRKITEKGRLTEEDAQSVLLQAVDEATLKMARDTPISNETAERIGNVYKSIDSTWFDDPNKLITWPGFLSSIYSNTLYRVLHGQNAEIAPGKLSNFRFQEGEHPIQQRNTILAEYRSVSNGSKFHAVSVPIGGGMYYRIGSSERARHLGLVPVGDGLMVITNQAICFSSHETNFRLPYTSIIRTESFSEGFGIYENHGRGKVFLPGQLGTMEEGWYFYNLVSALMAKH